MSDSYSIKSVFHSLQGEGMRAGSANVFVRFAGCNLQCSVRKHGFNCDTDFKGGTTMTRLEITAAMELVRMRHQGAAHVRTAWAILTGGEPLLQVDAALLQHLTDAGYLLALETNGTRALTPMLRAMLRHVACAPKAGEAVALDSTDVDEMRVVLRSGQHPTPEQMEYAEAVRAVGGATYVSPAFCAPGKVPEGHAGSFADFNAIHVAWCVEWCLHDPRWRLSMQQHKVWGVS